MLFCLVNTSCDLFECDFILDKKMAIPIDIENAIKRFKELKDDEKAKIITDVLNKLSDEKSLKNILKRHLKNSININIDIKEVIGENGKRANAKADIIDNKKVIFIDTERAVAFYSTLLKINKRVDLNEDEILAISYYIHEYIHHLQKELWKIDVNDRNGQIAYAMLETLTEVSTRKLTITFLTNIYGNEKKSYFEDIFNRRGGYKDTANRFDSFFKSLDRKTIPNERKDIFNEIVKMLQVINDLNKNPNEIVERLLDIVNENKKQKDKLTGKHIENILLGK